MKSLRLFRVIVACVLAVELSGCGTVAAMTNVHRDTPLVYGGTRLDTAAIADDDATLKKFDVGPPAHPGADLPASALLDTILLPGTLVAAAFRAMFW